MSSIISLYPHIKESKASTDIQIDLFLGDILKGKWQDIVIPIRLERDPVKQRDLKSARAPYVTISGKFKERNNNGLASHSGFIAIDIDDVEDPEAMKDQLRTDQFVYAMFTSIGGKGLCVLFKINGAKHLDAFLGLQEYLFSTYNIIIDPSCKDVSRPRYISYDPFLYSNERAKKFEQYCKADKRSQVRVPDVVFVQTDFDAIVAEVSTRRIDITSGYHTWLKIGFALADKFGEAGRQYFHVISQAASSYTPSLCDRQYTNCLKAGGHGISIASLYWLVKEAGIETESERTREISRIAYNAKKAKTNPAGAVKTLELMGIQSDPLVQDIVNQVFEGNIKIQDQSDIEAVEIWLRENHDLKKNLLSAQLENHGVTLTENDINTIELEIRKLFPKMDYATIARILNSKAIRSYHPIHDFFLRHIDRQPNGAIDELFGCIQSTTGAERFPDYVKFFGRKWLVGLVACLFDDVSPLMLILCGAKKGTGKTYFFENFLPNELREFVAKKDFSMMNNETFRRDMEIAITKYWLIYDDEMGGKSKRDQGHIKSLLSTSTTSVRASHARHEEKRKRIAGFAGTTNDVGLLSDPTGNRRLIPIEVQAIDKARKDKIDPIDYLMEAYHLYRAGFDFRVLDQDIDVLEGNTSEFQIVTIEEEMVSRYFAKPKEVDQRGQYLTGTDIKNILERWTKSQLNPNKITAGLKSLGIEQEKPRRVNGVLGRFYYVIELGSEVLQPLQTVTRPF